MEDKELEMIKVKIDFDYKEGKKTVEDLMPNISQKEDYIIQYFGIWRIIFDCVKNLKAKTVLEFGTRDGYSTRLFSEALKSNNGDIYTVDINPPTNDLSGEDNIHIITEDIMRLDWSMNVDILYIDDWHNPWHLYSELDKFSKLARVVMIHDVCLEMGEPKSLLRAIEEWCVRNMMVWSVYPLNGCGFAIIEIEKSKKFYGEKK